MALEYLGSSGAGWQTQPGGIGIADVLTGALKKIATPRAKIVGTGRTDTGVHALWQVVHFDLPASCNRPAKAWVLGVNKHLPASIRVRWARRVPADFHARFSVSHRTYAYLIWNAAILPAFRHGRVALERRGLNTEAMQNAADLLCGEHDFAAFRSRRCAARNSVRKVEYLRVGRRGHKVFIEIRADAFLQRMVRIIAGSLWQVGLGQWPPAYIGDILRSGDRTLAADTAVAEGLYFLGPDYPPCFGVPPAPGIQRLLADSR